MPLLPVSRPALALAALLLLAAPSWAQDEAPGLDDARSLVEAGHFAAALALLRPLLDEAVVDADALFLYGFAALEASQLPDINDDLRPRLLNEAIGAFHTMLVDWPDLVRVRLELARAFYFSGEGELARRHFEQVLAGDVPPPVVANVRAFLDQIRARKRWSFNLGFALAPDSNIGGTSDERIIYIFNLPFRRNAEELTTSGIGISVWGGAEYQVPLDDSMRLRVGAEFARREYERSQFDQLFVASHVGPRWLIDRATEASLLASVRQRWSGTTPDHRDLGARLEMGRSLGSRVTLFGQASWHGRRYRTRTHLDGPVMAASLRGTWVITPTVRADLSGGYGWERPRVARERNRSLWAGVGTSIILPWGFTVGGGADVRWTDYERGWFPFVANNGPREDRILSLRVSVLNRAVTVLGFSPELVLVKEERTSSAQFHGYERTRGELRFIRQF